jgi:hypothetical protein
VLGKEGRIREKKTRKKPETKLMGHCLDSRGTEYRYNTELPYLVISAR